MMSVTVGKWGFYCGVFPYIGGGGDVDRCRVVGEPIIYPT